VPYLNQPTSGRIPRAATVALAGLTGLALTMGVGRFAFTPLLPLMQSDDGVSITQGGLLAAANYLGYLLGALAALAVNARASSVIRSSLIVNAGATLAMGLTHQFAAWSVWRGLAGFASAFLFVFISAACLQQLAPARRPMLNATVFAGVGAGIFAVGALTLVLHKLGFSSSKIWIALGVGSAGVGVLLFPVFRDSTAPAPAARSTSAAAHVQPWRLVLCYGFFGFGYIIPATFLPAMAKATAGGSWAFGLSWPVFGLAAFASTFAAARLAKTQPVLRTWRAAQVIMAIGVALPAITTHIASIIAAACCVGGTFMVVTMLGIETARASSVQPRKLIAAMTAAFAAGQLAGPLAVSGLVESGAGFGHALLLSAAALLIGITLLTQTRVPRESTKLQSRKPYSL
jgi:predicted MFS family arabinose efflux permease